MQQNQAPRRLGHAALLRGDFAAIDQVRYCFTGSGISDND